MAVVKAEGIVGPGDVFVKEFDGLHLFDESLVRKKPASRRPTIRGSSNVLIDDRANGVQVLFENGKVTLVEN